MADVALILAEQYLRNRDSDATSTVEVNAIEGKGPPRSQFTEGLSEGRLLMQITCSMSDQLQVAFPLSILLLEGCFSA
jgi:hypothetical protein